MLRASWLDEGRPVSMLYAGLDLSRKRLDFHLLDSEGATVEVGAAPPDADGLLSLTRRLDRVGCTYSIFLQSDRIRGFGMRPSLCPHGRQRHLRRRRSGWETSSHAPDLWPKGVCRESRISLQIGRDRIYAPYGYRQRTCCT